MSVYDTEHRRNSTRFYRLVEKLDLLLRHFASNIYIINNSNIHLPRNHPEYIYYWGPIVYKKSPESIDLIKITFSFVSSILNAGLVILNELFLKKSKNIIPISKNNIDYLFISHLVQTSMSDSDFYFGDLISDLSNSESRTVRLLIPHNVDGTNTFDSKNYQSILLNHSLGKLLLLKYVINNFIAILILIVFCQKNKFTYYETLSIIIGQLENFYNYKLTVNIDMILSQNKIKKLITTFEGNAIESSIFYLSSKFNIKSYGYQHAPIIKDQNSIFRSITPELSPDIILASGPYTLLSFQRKLMRATTVKLMGSPKSVDYKLNMPEKKTFEVLLVPDGNIESVIKFCSLGRDLACRNAELVLTIRAHPLFREVIDKQMNSIGKISNFSLTRNNLEDDLKNATWVIYENSSVAIQALYYYCKLIYYENPLANIDPLFDLHYNKFSAVNSEEIITLFQTKYGLIDHITKLAYKFGKNYFSPLDLNIF